MHRSRTSRVIAIALVVVTAVFAASCGKQGSSSGGGNSSGPRIGLVTDIGGLNDRSFNASAARGFERAKSKLGAKGSIIESKSSSDYSRNLGTEVKNKSELVVGVGFLMADAMKEAAGKAPNTNFAIIDSSYTDDKGWGASKNLVSLMFREQEAGYLAGVLAGAAEEEGTLQGLNSAKVVSVVGGMKIPPVDRYIAGFQAGVMKECGGCKVIVAYSQDFTDQSKCQDIANTQIARGSDIVFQVAGGCGLGALDAAKTKGIWGIGVDGDQAYLGSHILTSAVKRIDNAVFDTVEQVKNDQFVGGRDVTYGLKEDGVGLGKVSPAASKYQSVVDAAAEGIKNGSITVPDTV
ncbi:MAG: BMP family ABC transporter substrate-binding protein [Thermoleophilia bacterium]|nr:BMP family ABC transporter substrate-binding protein [Thermoleophilia bacterium]